MKSSIRIIVLVMFCFANKAFSQTNPAKVILDKVSKTYSAYKTIKADFVLTGHNKQENSDYNQKGRVYLIPGSGKYKIEMSNQALISDGKTQWSILTDLGEVQITNVNPNDNSINPSTIFSFYEKGYRMKKKGENKVAGNTLYVIELIPTDQSQNIAKIEMRINQSNNFIYDASIYDKNGNKYLYTLTNIETNKVFSLGIFNFYKHNYPGIEIVDLR